MQKKKKTISHLSTHGGIELLVPSLPGPCHVSGYSRQMSKNYKEIQPVHSEGDQPWGFFGRNDAKAETPVLWPPHVKS